MDGVPSDTMPDPFDQQTPVVRKLPIIILIDVSGTMHEDQKIGSVNNAISEALEKLEDMEVSQGIEIVINALTFGHTEHPQCRWMFEQMMQLNAVSWQNLSAEGNTPLGDAYFELDSKLTSHGGFMTAPSAIYAPVLILITDGMPSNRKKVEEGLDRLKSNSWFLNSVRRALGIGLRTDAERQYLYDFVGGNPDYVYLSDSDSPSLVASIKPVIIDTALFGATRVIHNALKNKDNEHPSENNEHNVEKIEEEPEQDNPQIVSEEE